MWCKLTSELRLYDSLTDSWRVVSQMRVKRYSALVAVLPNDTLMVCGGSTPDGVSRSFEMAFIPQ